jgi:membrane-bound lytic murein transglycosylase D
LGLLVLTGCAAEPLSSPLAQLRLSPAGQAAVPSPPPLPSAALSDGGADQGTALLEAEPLADAGEDGDLLDAASADVEEDEPLDAETLEDNAVLQAADIAAPEEEGETVFLDENDFDFPVVDNEKVRYFIDYFSGPVSKVVRNWLERSTRYLPMMQEIFAEHGLPRDLVYLAMIESGFNNKAYSRARASGPWQFIESTGRH